MPSFKKIGFGLLVAAFLATPSSARAQYFFGGNPYGYGGWGGWGGGLGGFGGYGFGGMPYGYGGGYNMPYYYSSYYPSYSPIIQPGFGASESVRARMQLYPAIAEPNAEIIQAALTTDEKGRARIDVRLPTDAAQVRIDGVLMKQTGIDRMYLTPKLNPASKYAMNVEISWMTQSGRTRTVHRQITVRAGEISSIDLRDGY